MKKLILMTAVFFLMAVNAMVFISAAESSDNVINNPAVTTILLEQPVIVMGENCSPTGEAPSEKEITIQVPKSDRYTVFARASRGSISQIQTNEAYFLVINTNKGPISKDDAGEEEFSIRIDNMGIFRLSQGEQKITVKSAAKCPPSISENSVAIDAFYLLPTSGSDNDDDEDDEDDNDDDNDNDNGKNGGSDHKKIIKSLIDCNDNSITYPEKEYQCKLERGYTAPIRNIYQNEESNTVSSNLNDKSQFNLQKLLIPLAILIAFIIILIIIVLIFKYS